MLCLCSSTTRTSWNHHIMLHPSPPPLPLQRHHPTQALLNNSGQNCTSGLTFSYGITLNHLTRRWHTTTHPDDVGRWRARDRFLSTVDGSEIRGSPVDMGSLSNYLQGFIHPRWLFGISSINSIIKTLQQGKTMHTWWFVDACCVLFSRGRDWNTILTFLRVVTYPCVMSG